MSNIFSKEVIFSSSLHQDSGRLHEIGKHELLQSDDGDLLSFDQVRELGR